MLLNNDLTKHKTREQQKERENIFRTTKECININYFISNNGSSLILFAKSTVFEKKSSLAIFLNQKNINLRFEIEKKLIKLCLRFSISFSTKSLSIGLPSKQASLSILSPEYSHSTLLLENENLF